jgi:arylsulfatase A-like enzyme
MPNLRSSLLQGGRTFDKGYVSSPKCCPSRTSALSGRYTHRLNDATLGWCGDFASREGTTFVAALAAAGYATSLTGKYTNAFDSFCAKNIHVPPDYNGGFFAMCDESRYFNTSFNDNGVPVLTGDSPEDYGTSLIGNRSVTVLAKAAAAGTPFYAMVSVHAPHLPAVPPPWYADSPVSDHAPRTPNWNTGMTGKHWQVAANGPMGDYFIAASDALHADRLRCLMAVDDVIGAVMAQLVASGVADDTFVFMTR